MPDDPSRGYGQNDEVGLFHGDGPHSGRSRCAPDRRNASTDGPSAADPRSAACSRDFAVTPGDLDGDDWDQEAALAAFMADIESGYDPFTSSVGLEPDDADWPPTGEQVAGPAADTAVLPPEAYPASDNTARKEGLPVQAIRITFLPAQVGEPGSDFAAHVPIRERDDEMFNGSHGHGVASFGQRYKSSGSRGDDELTNTKKHHGATSWCHLLPCWAHEKTSFILVPAEVPKSLFAESLRPARHWSRRFRITAASL